MTGTAVAAGPAPLVEWEGPVGPAQKGGVVLHTSALFFDIRDKRRPAAAVATPR